MILALVIIFIFLIVIIKNLKLDAFSRRFLYIFVTIWFVVLILATIDICKVGPIRSSTNFIFIGSIISFLIGFFLIHRRSPSRDYLDIYSVIDSKINKLSNIKLFRLVYLLATLIVIYQIIRLLPILIYNGNMGDGLRYDALTGGLFSAKFILLKDFVLGPLYNIAMPIFAYVLIRGNNNSLCILLGLYSILYPSMTGGRMGFFILAFITFSMYIWFIAAPRKMIRDNFKGLSILAIASVIFLFSIMTVAKKGDVHDVKGSLRDLQESILMEPLIYFVCPTKAFEYGLDHNYRELLDGGLDGRSTLAAFDFYVNPLFNKITGRQRPNANSTIGYLLQDEWISLGQSVPAWNAMYTSNMYFYLDFGIIGCILLPLLFGILVSTLMNQLFLKQKLSLFILTFYAIRLCIMSVLSFFPVEGDVVPLLITIFLWSRIEKKCTSKNIVSKNYLR